jgi:phospholipase C
MDRRAFLKGAAAAAAGVGLGAKRADAVGLPEPQTPPVNLVLPSLGKERPRPRTPVEHLVVVMMENRSVDHYLGWYGAENPDFDGIQHRTYPDLRTGRAGRSVATSDWGAHGRNNFHGRGFHDPNHGWDGGRLERNGGRMDGWLHPKTKNDELALAYYGPDDLPIWSQLTRGWQTYDRWFCSVLGPTQPNRYYLYSGTSAGLKDNSIPPDFLPGQKKGQRPHWALGWDWPTVWDLCRSHGLSSAYYFSSLPEAGLWGLRQLDVIQHVTEFYTACQAGTLPQVSIIDPWFTAPTGIANDDHPLADIRLGQMFLSDIVEAFTTSPLYRKSALVITYDEWGGFWDHVDPPRIGDQRATDLDPGGTYDFGQLGFRIPSTVISPWTRHHQVDHTVYEHTSYLRFVCENWGLPPLTQRVESTNSLGHAFRRFRTFDPEHDLHRYRMPFDAQLQGIVDSNLSQIESGKVPRVFPSALPVAPADGVGHLERAAEAGWFDSLPIDLDHRFEDCYLSPSSIRALLRG